MKGEYMFDAIKIIERIMFERERLLDACDEPTRENNQFVPTEESLKRVIETVFWTSIATEETRCPMATMEYVGDQSRIFGGDCIKFLQPIYMDIGSLKKLSFAHDYTISGLLWGCDERNDPVILGIRMGITIGGIENDGFRIRMIGPGQFNVMVAGKTIYGQHGNECVTWQKNSGMFTNAWMRVFGKPTNNLFLHIGAVLDMIKDKGHGGSIWICREKGNTTIKIGYPVNSSLPGKDNLERRYLYLQGLANLAGIDGAVLVNCEMKTLGFAAFIENKNGINVKVIDENTQKTIRVEDIGGGRHRSGVTFCNECFPAMALVVSQDGKVKCIYKAEKDEDPTCFTIPIIYNL